MTARQVRIVLDTSAIVAYTRGSIDVGEVIAEVDDERAAAALPVLCLVEATQHIVDAGHLDLLVNHSATVVIAAEARDWRALAEGHERVGGWTPPRPFSPRPAGGVKSSAGSQAFTAVCPTVGRSFRFDIQPAL